MCASVSDIRLLEKCWGILIINSALSFVSLFCLRCRLVVVELKMNLLYLCLLKGVTLSMTWLLHFLSKVKTRTGVRNQKININSVITRLLKGLSVEVHSYEHTYTPNHSQLILSQPAPMYAGTRVQLDSNLITLARSGFYG